MTTTAASRTADYKGRTYRLLWVGQTKYGRRARLEFADGSKEFWVPASKIAIHDDCESPNHRPSIAGSDYCGHECPVSGKRCCAANGPCHDCI